MPEAIQVPTYKKVLQGILNRKRAVPPVKTVAVIESYPVKWKYPTKQEDTGTPIITCAIGGIEIKNALCDLGAGVSVMSFSMYTKLNLGVFSNNYNFTNDRQNYEATCRNDWRRFTQDW